jgi:NTE family protein
MRASKSKIAQQPTKPASASSRKKPRFVLVLQGGGALAAYHVGAYQALAEHGLAPYWVCGASTGAINAAVIAGNPPEARLRRLEELWNSFSWPHLVPSSEFIGPIPDVLGATSKAEAKSILFGQPNFFVPRRVDPMLLSSAASQDLWWYDLAPLRNTLLRLVNFSLINSADGERLSLGVIEVDTGSSVVFDNKRSRISPEHVLASVSLPPEFPPTIIEGTPYWDGSLGSRSPISYVLDELWWHGERVVVIVIALHEPKGPPLTSVDALLQRMKQVQDRSRMGWISDAWEKMNLHHVRQLARIDDSNRRAQRVDLGALIYTPPDVQINSGGGRRQCLYGGRDFSPSAIAAHKAAGYRDMTYVITQAHWTRELHRADYAGSFVAWHISRNVAIEAVLTGESFAAGKSVNLAISSRDADASVSRNEGTAPAPIDIKLESEGFVTLSKSSAPELVTFELQVEKRSRHWLHAEVTRGGRALGELVIDDFSDLQKGILRREAEFARIPGTSEPDLKLIVRHREGRIEVSSPSDRASYDHYVLTDFKYPETQFRNSLRGRLHALYSSSEDPDDTERELKLVGKKLADCLPEKLFQLLRRADINVLELRHEVDFDFPFELCYLDDPKDPFFVGDRKVICRWYLGVTNPPDLQIRPIGKVAFLQGAADASRIECELLERIYPTMVVPVSCVSEVREKVFKTNDFELIHFTGHCLEQHGNGVLEGIAPLAVENGEADAAELRG